MAPHRLGSGRPVEGLRRRSRCAQPNPPTTCAQPYPAPDTTSPPAILRPAQPCPALPCTQHQVTATTFRKVQRDSGMGADSERVKLKLAIAVEGVEYDAEGGGPW